MMKHYPWKKTILIALLLLGLCGTACTGGGEQHTEPGTTKNEETGKMTEPATSTPATEPATEPIPGINEEILAPWDASIQYAGSLRNGVQASFTDPARTAAMLSNGQIKLNFQMSGAMVSGVTGFSTLSGQSYRLSAMDVYLKAGADTYFASQSQSTPHMNIYRLGYYYDDIHFLGQLFQPSEFSAEGGVDLLQGLKQNAVRFNMVSGVTVSDGTITYTVADSTDPYINFNKGFSCDTYNAIRLTIKTETATDGQIFYGVNGTGFTGTQLASFRTIPGRETTVLIPLAGLSGFTGNVTSLRIDCGARNGEKIEILGMSAVALSGKTQPVTLDRVFHTYSDRLFEQYRFVVTGELSADELGADVRLNKSDVAGILIHDASGYHKGTEGVDFSTVDAVAFDVVGTGVMGYIRQYDDGGKTLFSLTEEDGVYVLRHALQLTGSSHASGEILTFSHRIYTDESQTHSFLGFRAAVEEELHPLTGITVTDGDSASYVGYDSLRGCYTFHLSGTDFTTGYNNPQKQFKVCATVNNPGQTRHVYILATSEQAGCLECGALLDENNRLLPVQVEICKNFTGENEEALYEPGDGAYGEAIFPLSLRGGQDTSFTVLDLYQNWGVYPLRQLSAIRFIAPYYHLSVGVTETNCIAPYFVYGKDLWTLPDFRAQSAPLWASQPQHTSMGRLHFLSYTDSDGNHVGSESQSADISSSGPVYADISMGYLSDDGKILADYRHLEMPQTDENRTYYQIKLTVLSDVTISDFAHDFSFFSVDGRSGAYRKLGYLNEANECVVSDTSWIEGATRTLILGSEGAYFDYYDSNQGDYVNFALLIKNANFVIGGESVEAPFVVVDSYSGGLNYANLSLNLGEVTLKAGDTLTIDMILLPWGSQYSKDDKNVRKVRDDSLLNPFTVVAQTGTVVDDPYLPHVQAENGEAIFRLSGGDNNAAVVVSGLSSYAKPTIEILQGDEWVTYKTNHYDYDGYTITLSSDGTYSVAFAVDMTGGTPHTFRVKNAG